MADRVNVSAPPVGPAASPAEIVAELQKYGKSKEAGELITGYGYEVTDNPFYRKFGAEYSALPRVKDNKTIRVTDEDAPEESRGQQAIFLGR
jgi:hypothetical protein